MKLPAAVLGLVALASQAVKSDAKMAPLMEWSEAFDNAVKDGTQTQNILGGEDIEPGSRPWLVPVVGRYFCGGSLISPSVVMTGEHPPAWVEFNRYDWFKSDGVKRVYINNQDQCSGDVVYHPYYDDSVIGVPYLNWWGPEAATLNYIPNDQCTKKPYRWREEYIHDSSLCAIGDEAPMSSCSSDSGGALNLLKSDKEGGGPTNIQVGIVSWGYNYCYRTDKPGVYTRVSEIADWVKETVCARKGELCKQSKSGKMSKMKKKYPDTCVPVSTMAPSTPWPTGGTYAPSITPQPWTPFPTPSSTFDATWPTWMPTDSKARKM
ncbi:hypothetical protein ACHAWO_009280 [Cyclotella atomus]|uniref:Peptidase S1 domain-containing protein n=1 Tax=Cyclotella atomus TaxID=382360 RepID=A0ABD3NEC4_9STRA